MNSEVTSVLDVASLSKRYAGQPAIADVSVSIRPGEVLGLIGPNGAGKTTLLESIAGLLPVDSGRVTWSGRPLVTQRRRDAMFYLPDGIRPYADQYVVEVLAFFAGTYGARGARLPMSSRVSGSARCSPSALRPSPKATAAG
jgi:ABC-2 type transport system ATP-binding protein